MLVRVSNALGIGRPAWAIEEGRVGAEIDHLRWLEPVLVANVELVLARSVAEVGEGLAVRRPAGVALGRARCLGDVARITLFCRQGKDIAMGLDHHPHPGWRDVKVLHFSGKNFSKMRGEGRKVSMDGDRYSVLLTRRRVVKVNRAKLLIHQSAWPGRDGLQVIAVILDHLLHYLAAGVVAEQRNRAITVRKKVNRIALPNRAGIVRVLTRNLYQVEGLRIDQPNRSGLPATVVLPRL